MSTKLAEVPQFRTLSLEDWVLVNGEWTAGVGERYGNAGLGIEKMVMACAVAIPRSDQVAAGSPIAP